MFTELELTNFKPFAKSRPIRLAPITLIYGPNSGGKSSLIQSLLLVKQTLTPNGSALLVTRGNQIDLGSYRSLIHRHEYARNLSITTKVDTRRFKRPIPPPYKSPEQFVSTTLEYRWRGREQSGVAALDNVKYRVESTDRLPLSVHLTNTYEGTYGPYVDSKPRYYFQFADEESIDSLISHVDELARLTRQEKLEYESGRDVIGLSQKQRELLRAFLTDSQITHRQGLPGRIHPTRSVGDLFRNVWLQKRLDALSLVTNDVLRAYEGISYLGPLRSHPARHYVTVSSPHTTVGSAGENTPQILHRKQLAVTAVNRWFESFQIPYELEIDRIGNEVTGSIIALVLKDRRSQVAVAPSDVGFGIGQLLPILVEGSVTTGRVLCVEQPEIHLHPRLQAHLADFFIETAGLTSRADDPSGSFQTETLENSRKNQWIIETHSETLMLRMQRRIEEGRIRPTDVSVVYVDNDENGSVAMELRLDDKGGFIDEWPDGFFEESVREMFGG